MSRTVEQFLASLLLIVAVLGVSFYEPPHRAPTSAETSPLGALKPIPSKDARAVPEFDPATIIATSTLESIVTGLKATSTKAQKTKQPASTSKQKTQATPPPIPPVKKEPLAVSAETPVAPDSSITATLKKSLVNILCTSHKAPLRGVSGSGVIIDSEGIILTVAHVAQSELLSEELGEGVISCVVRTGDPARSAYKAKLVYISEPWLKKNSTTLISSQPMGTGENDFALLAITRTTNGAPLPSYFPAVPFYRGENTIGEEVGIGGYAAQYLTSAQVFSSLSPTFLTGSIASIFTFHTTSQDVLSILGGKASQEGSSGGGVVNANGKLIGLITTSEISGDFATRHLRVITPTHIESSFQSDTGQSIASYLGSASASVLVENYSSKVASLGNFLADAIGLR